MASSSITKHQPYITSIATLEDIIVIDGCNYVPEAPMQEEKVVVQFSQALISYSLVGHFHAFMGPLPRPSKKPSKFASFFPSFSSDKPLVCQDGLFDPSFMKHRVFHSFYQQSLHYLAGQGSRKKRKKHGMIYVSLN